MAVHEPFSARAGSAADLGAPFRASATSTPTSGWYQSEPCVHAFSLKFKIFTNQFFTNFRRSLNTLTNSRINFHENFARKSEKQKMKMEKENEYDTTGTF